MYHTLGKEVFGKYFGQKVKGAVKVVMGQGFHNGLCLKEIIGSPCNQGAGQPAFPQDQEPAATSNVSHQMTVIFCEHKNNSGGVQQIFTLHFHILLLLIYF